MMSRARMLEERNRFVSIRGSWLGRRTWIGWLDGGEQVGRQVRSGKVGENLLGRGALGRASHSGANDGSEGKDVLHGELHDVE